MINEHTEILVSVSADVIDIKGEKIMSMSTLVIFEYKFDAVCCKIKFFRQCRHSLMHRSGQDLVLIYQFVCLHVYKFAHVGLCLDMASQYYFLSQFFNQHFTSSCFVLH